MPLNLGDGTLHESMYFNDELLTLRYNEDATCLRRRLNVLSANGSESPVYTLFLAKKLRSRVAGHGEHVDVATATGLLRRAFARDSIAPYCLVRFRRLRYGIPEVGTITIDTDVRHYSMLPSVVGSAEGPVEMGVEPHPRVHLQLSRKPNDELRAALDSVVWVPHMPKRWMGYYYTRRKVKADIKRVNELAGFEYELKLDAEHLDIDVKCFPFPILRVFQTQTFRRYYDGYRVSFRLARGTMVRKGVVEMIDGVPRRLEQKRKGLSAWTLPEARLEMRRIKKTYMVINPDSKRTYNICLDLCLSPGKGDESMHQIEIEYSGTLNSTPGPSPSSRAVEKAVIADMLLIRDKLVERHGFKETTATKRDFARKST
jgi:hypothetical protein